MEAFLNVWECGTLGDLGRLWECWTCRLVFVLFGIVTHFANSDVWESLGALGDPDRHRNFVVICSDSLMGRKTDRILTERSVRPSGGSREHA